MRIGKTINEDVKQKYGLTQSDMVESPPDMELVNQIDFRDLTTISQFGTEPLMKLSKVSDPILNSAHFDQIGDSSEIMGELAEVIKFFEQTSGSLEKNVLEKMKEAFLQRFNLAEKGLSLEQIQKMSSTIGDRVKKIDMKIRMYSKETKENIKTLSELFESNKKLIFELSEYVRAAKFKLEELEQMEAAEQGESRDEQILDALSIEAAKRRLVQKIFSMETAVQTSISAVIQLKSVEEGNVSLLQRIEDTLTTTIPIMKQTIASSVMLKKQQAQMEGVEAISKATEMAMIGQAKNSRHQQIMMAELQTKPLIATEKIREVLQIYQETKMEVLALQQEANIRKAQYDSELKLLNSESAGIY